MSNTHHLIWFRRDLRLSDNPALSAACQQAKKVTAIYFDCPKQWNLHKLGCNQLKFIQENLAILEKQLAELGIPLLKEQVPLFTDIPQRLQTIVEQQQIDAIFANIETPLDERIRDKEVQDHISVTFNRFHNDCIIPPGQVKTQLGNGFQVFTPFAKKWCSLVAQQGIYLTAQPKPIDSPVQSIEPSNPKDLLTEASYSTKDWPAGEEAAQKRLAQFCEENVVRYSKQRDFPAIVGTSVISAYLAIGVLSPRQCLNALQNALGYLPLSKGEHGFSWLNEIIWREFYRHLMFEHLHLNKNLPFKSHTSDLKWNNDPALFQSWIDGQTGFPIVDAAMRCLKQTGWMHNRLRMIVASFLTKDLHIDWRWGHDYFMSQLIDADFPSNNGGWQWAAGTGADAAPYFRVFNPTTQGQRFDKDAEFIRTWIPELRRVPLKQIHQPENWLARNDNANNYPVRIVDHKAARLQAIAMFKSLESAV